MDLKFYKIYAFTDLHVASGDRGVSALCLCLWAQQRRKRKIFSDFFSQFSLSPHPLEFGVQLDWDDMSSLCVRVCVASVC